MPSDFAQQVKKYREKAEDRMSALPRAVAFEFLACAVSRSPVDTGRFKANHQVTINMRPPASLLAYDKGGNKALAEGRRVLAGYKAGDTIFISNNLAYAMPLEYGHSKKQAPFGVYRVSAEEIAAKLPDIVGYIKRDIK